MTKIEHEYDPDLDAYVETDESLNRRMEDRYRPNPAKPWRVTWGFGCFEDFATLDQAKALYAELPPGLMPQEPVNAVETGQS